MRNCPVSLSTSEDIAEHWLMACWGIPPEATGLKLFVGGDGKKGYLHFLEVDLGLRGLWNILVLFSELCRVPPPPPSCSHKYLMFLFLEELVCMHLRNVVVFFVFVVFGIRS